jgi:hypothetical protein
MFRNLWASYRLPQLDNLNESGNFWIEANDTHWISISFYVKELHLSFYVKKFHRGGTFTKEALEEIVSYQDVCTLFLSPLPSNLNKPKTVPNMFWICAPVLTTTLLKSTNKSDNVIHLSHEGKKKWSSCKKQVHVMTHVAKSLNKFLRIRDILSRLNIAKDLGMAARI